MRTGGGGCAREADEHHVAGPEVTVVMGVLFLCLRLDAWTLGWMEALHGRTAHSQRGEGMSLFSMALFQAFLFSIALF